MLFFCPILLKIDKKKDFQTWMTLKGFERLHFRKKTYINREKEFLIVTDVVVGVIVTDFVSASSSLMLLLAFSDVVVGRKRTLMRRL